MERGTASLENSHNKRIRGIMNTIKFSARILCFLGSHGWERTDHFGERKCPTCGGSYWGKLVEINGMRYIDKWTWYSARKMRAIEKAGKIPDLVKETGRRNKDVEG